MKSLAIVFVAAAGLLALSDVNAAGLCRLHAGRAGGRLLCAPVAAYGGAPIAAYSPVVAASPVVATAYYAPQAAYYPRTAPYYAAQPVVAPYYVARPVVAPAVAIGPVYATPVVVRAKVYVPGEPVRNFFCAITP